MTHLAPICSRKVGKAKKQIWGLLSIQLLLFPDCVVHISFKRRLEKGFALVSPLILKSWALAIPCPFL